MTTTGSPATDGGHNPANSHDSASTSGGSPFELANDIEVEAPARAVLDYVSNPQSWREWMPATHEMDSPDRPLLAGETFTEQWGTRQGEVRLAWRVTARTEPGAELDHGSPTGTGLWVAETETPFTGPIVARYEVTPLGPARCRYVRRISNPARPKAPTEEMVQRMNDEAIVCLANIKRNVEAAYRA